MVLSLWNQFLRRMWKNLGLWAISALKYYKQSLLDHFGMSLEDLNADRNANYRGPAHNTLKENKRRLLLSKLPKAREMQMILSWAVDAGHRAAGSGVCPTGFALYLTRSFYTKHPSFPIGMVRLTLSLHTGNV